MKNRSNSIVHKLLALTLLALAVAPVTAAEGAGKININTASTEQLTYLPRVGAVVAQRIVDFREQNGRFKAAQDLMLVQGIGEKTFALIEPYVALEGETTLTEKVQLPADEGR